MVSKQKEQSDTQSASDAVRELSQLVQTLIETQKAERLEFQKQIDSLKAQRETPEQQRRHALGDVMDGAKGRGLGVENAVRKRIVDDPRAAGIDPKFRMGDKVRYKENTEKARAVRRFWLRDAQEEARRDLYPEVPREKLTAAMRDRINNTDIVRNTKEDTDTRPLPIGTVNRDAIFTKANVWKLEVDFPGLNDRKPDWALETELEYA